MTQGIKDKVVVITGASSGLGEAASRQLAPHGAKLVLRARRLERLQALAEELSLGHDAAVQTDVTQHEQVRHLVDHAVRSHGRIVVIVNNAGLMPRSPLERGKVQDWDRMIDVNLSLTLAIWGGHGRGAADGTGKAAERVGSRLARPRQETPPCTCQPASPPSS
jgi:NADP-dependent 3-hydroxy acid dehydrogenase YdfG